MAKSGSDNQRADTAQLSAIGIAGGAFSGLFGVGGGSVMVPMLVLWRGLNEKCATGTSLLAIGMVAGFAVIGNAIFGSVDVTKGILIGIPAVGGVIVGTTLQQRMPDRLLSGLFALMSLLIAIFYVID